MRQFIFRTTVLVVLSLVFSTTRADHASVGFGTGAAAPIATESAIPLAKGQVSVGLRNEYVRFNEFSDQKLRNLRENDPEGDLHSVESIVSPSVGIAFGVTKDFTVGLKVPYIFRNNIREAEHGHDEDDDDDMDHHEEEEIEVETLGDLEGVGDTILFGQYRFLHLEDTDTHVSALFGVKAPTGRTNRKTDTGERFETEFQPGTGSWDGLAGMAFTQVFGRLEFDTSLLYTIVTEGSQHTDMGDIFSYNMSLAYRFNGDGFDESLGLFKNPSVDAILEVNGEWRDKEEVRGEEDNNSGGNMIYLSPGIRFIGGPNWNAAVSFGIPIAKNLNGDQVNPDYRIISSINFNF